FARSDPVWVGPARLEPALGPSVCGDLRGGPHAAALARQGHAGRCAMCGIAGVLRFAGSGNDVEVVARMLAKLARRGPDDSGTHACGPVVLGNRRLAVLDRRPAAHQPMISPSGRLVVTFNGEI